MDRLLKFSRLIDNITEWSGRLFSYLVYVLMGGVFYEVVTRYLFHSPTQWAYDLSYMLYGTIFMMGASYTLLHKIHIRTDMLYNKWSPQKQGKFDAIMYIFLFFPAMILLLVAGYDYAAHSWSINEKSAFSSWMPILYPFKTVIPLSALMLIIQGISELIKCFYVIKTGVWR